MGKTLTTSARQLGQHSQTSRVIFQQQIIIPRDPEPEPIPLPAYTMGWPLLILVGGSVVALLCVWQFVPEQFGTLCQNLIRQILQFATATTN
jgi:hypothetical protein